MRSQCEGGVKARGGFLCSGHRQARNWLALVYGLRQMERQQEFQLGSTDTPMSPMMVC